MAEVDCELPQELTLRALDEQAGIGNLWSRLTRLRLQTEVRPEALAPYAA
jgi:hypothetical protein